MERRGESSIIGRTGGGAGRPEQGRVAAWVAALAVIAAFLVAVPTSGAFAAGTPTPVGADSAAASTVVNEPFTLFQGLSAGTIAPTTIVDVQPYSSELTPTQIDSLHSQNPNTKVIRYVDAIEAFDTVTAFIDPRTWSLDYARRLNTDAEWNDMWVNHQSWFLKDAQGQYIHRPSSNAFEMNPERAYLMDPGSPDWRAWLVSKVAQSLSYGYDGVFLDQCTTTPLGYSAMPAKYAGNYGLWRSDINGLINYMKGQLPTALLITNSIWQGQTYCANASPNPIDDNQEDGTEIEGFINANGIGPTESEANWLKEVMIVKKLGDAGKIVLARTAVGATDTNSPKRLFAYSLATCLLGKSGSSAYFAFVSYKTEAGFTSDYVRSVYNLPLGDPTGVYYQMGVAYRRDFTNGKVIVNPNDAAQTYTFTPAAADHYEDQDGNTYDSGHPLALPAKAAVVLIAIEVPPTVTAVGPSNGATLGGDSVVISGDDLTGASKVTFGDIDSVQFGVDSPTRITATTPAHAAGTVQVQVTTTAGASADTAADDFTYAEPGVPTITSLSPKNGSVDGGTTVTITGTDFRGLSGTAAVTFDGIDAAHFTVVSATKITATTPAHAEGAVDVTVTTVVGSATSSFTYTTTPVLTRYEQTDTNIAKTGTWAQYNKTLASRGSYGRSAAAGASATIYFNGTRLDWIAMKGTTTGRADVYLDGVRKATIDLYSAIPSYAVHVWSTGTLASGGHSVKIVRSSSNASGKYITLDAVDIAGTVSFPPIRYEQTNTKIVATGLWSNYAKSAASGASYGRSNSIGAAVTITFSGTRLDWIAMKGTTTGVADVYLDGGKVATIDLSASSASYQAVVWSTRTISNGVHTVKIQFNTNSPSGKYLTLDAVEVWGALR